VGHPANRTCQENNDRLFAEAAGETTVIN
jgi:hypothetical protein